MKLDLGTSAWVAAVKYRLWGKADLGPPMSSLNTAKLQDGDNYVKLVICPPGPVPPSLPYKAQIVALPYPSPLGAHKRLCFQTVLIGSFRQQIGSEMQMRFNYHQQE